MFPGGDSGVLVTAASEHDAPDRERAETYLRLQAEAELRRALAMPEYKPPRQPLPIAVVNGIIQQRRMQRRRAAVQRVMAQQASAGRTASRAAAPAARLLRFASATGSRLSTRLSGATWPLRRRFRRWYRGRGYQSPPAEQCAQRINTLASIFAAVGAISAETETDVTAGFAAALAARGRIEPDALLGSHMLRRWPMRRPRGAQLASAGPLSAHPVGLPATGEIEGVPVRFYLGVLVTDRGSMTLTIQARLQASKIAQDHRRRQHDPMFHALNETTAVDDRGRTYDLHFSGGGGDTEWDGLLHLHPAPAAGVRWLDMTLPGADLLRVPMDARPADLRVATAAVTTTAADRFLDAHTAGVLARGATGAAEMLADDRSDLPGVAGDLLASGVLTANSESVRRLAAAARYVGAKLHGALAGIEPGDMPADWISLLAGSDRADGPAGVIPVAAVLPEVDGAQCVIAELVSGKDAAKMQVHARGWPEPRFGGGARIEQFWWSARDDLGGWYFLGEGGGSFSNDEADLELRFSPAIDPKARALDLILTGPTTQAVVTVPLNWQEPL
ncbi:MAG TPA: hypothetical protein VMB74_16645 [Streptosporangiaceae bacterium]|nr:hypothetical protein [Streptosporangiaceae bacterium]